MTRSSRGWTRLEFLTVGAVLLTALALLAPAAEQARGQARLTQCRERMHRLGLALFEYHGQHHVLPPGLVATIGATAPGSVDFVAKSPVCDYPALANASGLTLMLPFLEVHEPYDQYNRSVACCSAANATAVATPVPAFLCPNNLRSGPAQPWGYYMKPTGFAGPAGPAATDYVFATGGLGVLTPDSPFALNTGGRQLGIPPRFRNFGGAFHVNSGTKFEHIRDGLSYTALMGEAVSGLPLGLDADGHPIDGVAAGVAADQHRIVNNAWSQGYVSDRRGLGGFGAVFAASAFNAWADKHAQMVAPGDQHDLTPKGWKAIPPNEGGMRFARGNWMASSVPNFGLEFFTDTGVRAQDGTLQGWRSRHPGKTPLVFGDGSVRLIGDDIDSSILVALTSARDGKRFLGPRHLPELCE